MLLAGWNEISELPNAPNPSSLLNRHQTASGSHVSGNPAHIDGDGKDRNQENRRQPLAAGVASNLRPDHQSLGVSPMWPSEVLLAGLTVLDEKQRWQSASPHDHSWVAALSPGPAPIQRHIPEPDSTHSTS
jgi:hypothetical protein